MQYFIKNFQTLSKSNEKFPYSVRLKIFVTQVGANWNQLITELIEWDKFGREVSLSKVSI
jgi:hypothetical protein